MKKWIRIFHPKPQAKFQLLCIPHAGGAASAYRNLSNKIGADIEVLSYSYLGEMIVIKKTLLITCNH